MRRPRWLRWHWRATSYSMLLVAYFVISPVLVGDVVGLAYYHDRIVRQFIVQDLLSTALLVFTFWVFTHAVRARIAERQEFGKIAGGLAEGSMRQRIMIAGLMALINDEAPQLCNEAEAIIRHGESANEPTNGSR